MHCPFCDFADTQVIDSRVSDEGDVVRRRRRCATCDKRFTTYERIELNLPTIIKRNGARVDFDRRKVRASMSLALRKRPVSAEVVDGAINRIEERLMALAVKELPSERIGELVIRELRKIDKVAYIRYASVYKNFEDVDEFEKAIAEVAPKAAPRKRPAN
jgi:transcriptional repressor NrdR